jgi:hypothetical protein
MPAPATPDSVTPDSATPDPPTPDPATTDDSAPAGPGERGGWRSRVRWSRARWSWGAAGAVAGLGLFFCYLRLSGTQPITSDAASNALEAWDMLHGNVLLHGWTLSDVSFYTTELPEYVVVEKILGLGPGTVHVAAAITYTLLILTAAVVAKGRATGREGVARALLAAGIMLAPQLGDDTHILLLQPDHVGTSVPVLIILILLDRWPRRWPYRWYTPATVGLLLAWVEVADRVAVVTAAVPLVLACCLRAGQRARPRRDRAFDVSLAVAGLLSLGLAALAERVLGSLGGYTLLPLNTQLDGVGSMPGRVWPAVKSVAELYGADVPGSGLTVVFAVVHLVGLALAVWAVSRGVRRFRRGDDLVAELLTLGILLNLAAYLVSTLPQTWWDAREIAAVLPLGAALAGRTLATDLLPSPRARSVAAVILAGYVAAFGYDLAQPAAVNPDAALVSWLEAHHLSSGLGTYTEGNDATLDSDGRVALRVPTWTADGAVPRVYQSDVSWYDPAAHSANFVVSGTAYGAVTVIPYRDILAAFGPPAHTYHVGTWTVMTWDKNLLADLGRPPSISPGNVP